MSFKFSPHGIQDMDRMVQAINESESKTGGSKFLQECSCNTKIPGVHLETCNSVIEQRMHAIFTELSVLNHHLLHVNARNPDAIYLIVGGSAVFWHEDILENISVTECLRQDDNIHKSMSFNEMYPTLRTIVRALSGNDSALVQIMDEVCAIDYGDGRIGNGAKGFCDSFKSVTEHYLEIMHNETKLIYHPDIRIKYPDVIRNHMVTVPQPPYDEDSDCIRSEHKQASEVGDTHLTGKDEGIFNPLSSMMHD